MSDFITKGISFYIRSEVDAQVYGEFRSMLKNYDKRIRPNYTGNVSLVKLVIGVFISTNSSTERESLSIFGSNE